MRQAFGFRWLLLVAIGLVSVGIFVTSYGSIVENSDFDLAVSSHVQNLFDQGKAAFRYDTFGSEAFWGDALNLHDAIKGEAMGGVGGGLTPAAALAAGLKVDFDKLPSEVVDALVAGQVDLNDPATTVTLLKLGAVVGLQGIFNGDDLTSVGVTCGLCHSTVDNSLVPGIGARLDGWANRDLNVGAIIALAPNLSPFMNLLGADDATLRAVFNSWGPGKFDAAVLLDGKPLGPDGNPAPVLIPPAFGLAGVNMHTYEGWGSVTHWNALVANLEMGGKGTFYDPRLNDSDKFPIAAANGFGNVRNQDDLITAKLPALHFYQLALPAPAPPDGSFDAAAAANGESLFNGKADCARCHVPPLFTEPGFNMHSPEEIGLMPDDFQASRGPTGMYRTTPLKGLWSHQDGGFYHDGRFSTLADVVTHYDNAFSLGLTADESADLVEYLKSLGDEGDFPSSVLRTGGPVVVPASFELMQNHPNPFNPSTSITYKLSEPQDIKIQIYAVTGQLVRTLVDGPQKAGTHEAVWNGRNDSGAPVATGTYFYQLWARNKKASKKMLLLK